MYNNVIFIALILWCAKF